MVEQSILQIATASDLLIVLSFAFVLLITRYWVIPRKAVDFLVSIHAMIDIVLLF